MNEERTTSRWWPVLASTAVLVTLAPLARAAEPGPLPVTVETRVKVPCQSEFERYNTLIRPPRR